MNLLTPYLHNTRINLVKPYLYGNVLDIGCGSADIVHFLQRNQQYVGIDFNKELLDHLRDTYPQYQFFEKDLEEGLDKRFEGCFNTILMVALIEHIKDPKNLMKNCHDLLSNDGSLVVTTPTPLGDSMHKLGSKFGLTSKLAVKQHVKIYSHNDLKQLLNFFGFEIHIYQQFELGMNQLCIAKKIQN